MSRLSRKPKQQQKVDIAAKYECFSLTENPFPTSPVNKDSKDRRINGKIYEADIRTKEYENIESAFLKSSQTDPSHLRLGYIWDTSYIGRGNGKSAFLVNLINKINENYCLDISNEINKCFAIYVSPETGGRTKTFDSFVDLIFESIYSSGIIASALASLRLNAIAELYPEKKIDDSNEEELIRSLNSQQWLQDLGMDYHKLMEEIWKNEFLQKLSNGFPFKRSRFGFSKQIVTEGRFLLAYQQLKKGREKLDFIFSDLVLLLLASGFNGAYIFVDDFERIPDFQSGRQRRDFAAELRSVLLDGAYYNTRYGFLNMFLVLHAGIPALISEAWSRSGLDQRYPLSPKVASPHLIPFEKLNREHVTKLIKKYLDEYRMNQYIGDPLHPFTAGAVNIIAESSEYNAATILRVCSALIEKSVNEHRTTIDQRFVRAEIEDREGSSPKEEPSLDDPATINLLQKAKDGR